MLKPFYFLSQAGVATEWFLAYADRGVAIIVTYAPLGVLHVNANLGVLCDPDKNGD